MRQVARDGALSLLLVAIESARVKTGRPRMAWGSQNGSSTDRPWSSADGSGFPKRVVYGCPWSSTDGPWFPKLVVCGWPEVVCGWPVVVYGWPIIPKTGPVRQQCGGLVLTVQKTVEVPKLQFMVMPVVVQQQVPMVVTSGTHRANCAEARGDSSGAVLG